MKHQADSTSRDMTFGFEAPSAPSAGSYTYGTLLKLRCSLTILVCGPAESFLSTWRTPASSCSTGSGQVLVNRSIIWKDPFLWKDVLPKDPWKDHESACGKGPDPSPFWKGAEGRCEKIQAGHFAFKLFVTRERETLCLCNMKVRIPRPLGIMCVCVLSKGCFA
jgi:hypothetical protein